MRRMFAPALLTAGLLCAPSTAQQVEVESYVLENGMEFLLVPRQDQPNAVAAGWLARVGSVNEQPGITGISHFFEHMMFKGTDTIGTNAPELDSEYSARIDELGLEIRELALTTQYERLKRGEIDDAWDAANDTPEMAELRAERTALMRKQQEETIVKDEFDAVYTKQGASGMNAFTSHDVTFYFITVPSNKLELWAWMEADRLLNSTFREFYSERDVVHEERRLRTESTPTGEFQEQFDSMFWLSSPYNWPVIGWPSDLNSYTREQAEHYYETYYAPNNLVGVIVGDFDVQEAKYLIDSYFSRLERGPEPPEVVTLEIEQKAEMRMNAECDCQPQVEVRYKAPPFMHEDSYAFEVLSEVLNGRTGRLYKGLVEGREVASSAFAAYDARQYAGAFSFSAETKGEASPAQLEEAWYEILTDLQQNPVGERELTKVKNQLAADSYRRLQSNFFLLVQLGYYEALGAWEYINDGPAEVQAVTTDDLMRIANDYFKPTMRSVATYERLEGAAPEDPELAALDPQVRAMVKQQLSQIEQVDDPDRLRMALSQMAAQANNPQVPEEFRPAIELMIKRVEARIAQLEQGGGN